MSTRSRPRAPRACGRAGTLAAAGLALLAAAAPAGAEAAPAPRWYKGNLHTHTLNTDGDSSPVDVVRWYREQGYHFVALTDHDSLTSVDGLNAIYATGAPAPLPGRGGVPSFFHPFLVIAGEEVTDRYPPREARGDVLAPRGTEQPHKAVHLGALTVTRPVAPQGGGSVAETLQRNVDAIRAASGVPVIHHPNYLWSLTAADLKALHGVKLLEIFNGHRQTNNLGGGGSPGVEAIWDDVLSSGALLYGVAADDAHHFKQAGSPDAMAPPGQGWVWVRAPELSAVAIVAALERGDFYASTGVELADYQVTSEAVTITIKPFFRSRYRILFIGRGGRILEDVPVDTVSGEPVAPVAHRLRGDEGYVRAKVIESNGKAAWTQPVLVGPASSPER
jgi:hypothetical protein